MLLRDNTKELVLSLTLMMEGVFPQLKVTNLVNDYPSLIKQIKKIYNPCAKARHINGIACIILCEISKIQSENNIYGNIEKQSAKQMLFANLSSIQNEIRDSLGLEIPNDALGEILDIMVENMPNLMRDAEFFLMPKMDIYNYLIAKRHCVNKELSVLLKRPLNHEEFEYIARSFLRFMSYGQDLESNNNGTKEKIQESREILLEKLTLIEAQIALSEEFISNLDSMERYPDCDLDIERNMLKQLKEQHAHYYKLQENFDLRDGSRYCVDSVKKYGLFAMIFCALSLGLSPPPKRQNLKGNPVIEFLKLVQGLSDFTKDPTSATCRVSRSFAQFNQARKENEEFDMYVSHLLNHVKRNPECIKTWLVANNVFQSLLPKIVLRPKFTLPSIDPTLKKP